MGRVRKAGVWAVGTGSSGTIETKTACLGAHDDAGTKVLIEVVIQHRRAQVKLECSK